MKAQQVSAALSVCSEAPFDHAWGEPIPTDLVTLLPPGSKKKSNKPRREYAPGIPKYH